MPMTMAEKILAAHCGRARVAPEEFIMARPDLIMAHDGSASITINSFRRIGIPRVFDPKKMVLISDHFLPARDMLCAENAKLMREFAKEQGITHYEIGRGGICHAMVPEQGLVVPGDLVSGVDSHSCTYGALGAFSTGIGMMEAAAVMATGEIWLKVPSTIKFVYHGRTKKWVDGKDLILYTIGQIGVDGALYSAMEFTGEAIEALPMDGRLTMANMSIEAGAKAGIFPVDQKTLEYVKPRAKRPYTIYESDADAEYAQIYKWDVSRLEPQVAFPHLPSNVRPISQLGEVRIDQAVIGSCTSGRLTDLRVAAQILKGRQVHPEVRCLIFPATRQVYLQALREGIIEAFVEAGAAVSTPTCGPCAGMHTGVLASGERAVSTTNRNFVGRMGAIDSEVYLASPAVAAASAILGRIGSPEEVVR